MIFPGVAYPKSEDFFSNIGDKVSTEKLNLHLSINNEEWKIEFLSQKKYDEQYWYPDPRTNTLYICGMTTQREIDTIKNSCWMMYHN